MLAPVGVEVGEAEGEPAGVAGGDPPFVGGALAALAFAAGGILAAAAASAAGKIFGGSWRLAESSKGLRSVREVGLPGDRERFFGLSFLGLELLAERRLLEERRRRELCFFAFLREAELVEELCRDFFAGRFDGMLHPTQGSSRT